MAVAWTDDISELWKHPSDFFPSGHATRNETLNASTRFLLYAGTVLAVVQRSALPVVGAMILSIILAMVYGRRHRQEVLVDIQRKRACTGPTRDNPYGNTVVTDFGTTKEPCPMTDEAVARGDALLQTYLYSDTDDLFGDEFAKRPFMSLPNGGTHPDFSSLANQLASSNHTPYTL